MGGVVWIVILAWWFLCAVAADDIAKQKRAGWAGFGLGFLFGPVGIIAAGFLDRRPNCPRCGGRLEGSTQSPYPVCQHCGVELVWVTGRPHMRKMQLGTETPETDPWLAQAEQALVASGLVKTKEDQSRPLRSFLRDE